MTTSLKSQKNQSPLPVPESPLPKPPKRYKVFLHNDDQTPMDFVVNLLRGVFQKNEYEATRLMLEVHHKGQALCGVYTHEIAETKTIHVLQMASTRGYPLKCTMEKDD